VGISVLICSSVDSDEEADTFAMPEDEEAVGCVWGVSVLNGAEYAESADRTGLIAGPGEVRLNKLSALGTRTAARLVMAMIDNIVAATRTRIGLWSDVQTQICCVQTFFRSDLQPLRSSFLQLPADAHSRFS
jgi:hypothetical protein